MDARRAGSVILCLVSLACSTRSQQRGAEERPRPESQSGSVARQLQATTTTARPDLVIARDPAWQWVRRFYARRDHRLAWIDGKPFGPRYASLIRAIEKAKEHGLDPEAYDLAGLKALRSVVPAGSPGKVPGDATLEAADSRLTYAFLRYASHLLHGRLDPQELGPLWDAAPRPRDLAQVLEGAIERGRVEAALEELAPAQPGYKALAAALARYRAIADRGGWPTLNLKPGTRIADSARELLARRLDVEGDLGVTWGQTGTDSALQGALRCFQRRHGLKDDGALDESTLTALNVPVSVRIRQIELNLERWRWVPQSFGARYILVNIPDFTLKAIEPGRGRLAMRAVVGKTFAQTPILSDSMTQVVFSPSWIVPDRIAREEVLPALLDDPNYLESQNMEILLVKRRRVALRQPDSEIRALDGVVFRQRPGSGNVMGDVKFAFPNRFDVYLHDTPVAASFDEQQRTFSHGCIRVEKPAELAQYVLRDKPYWTAERIAAAMRSGREQAVALTTPLPVHLVYWTAWVEEDGGVNFRSDVYGHDTAQERAVGGEERRVASGPRVRVRSVVF